MTQIRLVPYIDSSSALGVFVVKKGEQTFFSHGGVDNGFVGRYYGSMEGGNGVVVMTNTYNTAILDEIIASVATVYDWKGFYKPQIKKVVKVNNEILKTYVGEYKAGNNTVLIKKENSGLFGYQGANKMQLYFTTDTDFFLMDVPKAENKFTKDGQNKVDGIEVKMGSNIVKAQKIK